ncbi:MAG: hypothetical protein ACI8RE_001729 [Ilumatobacter sp.]
MGRRSHQNQFIDELKKMNHEKATFAQLAASLGGDWTAEAVEVKARTFEEKDLPIHIVRGGVQYFGHERGTKPGLYKEIRRGIEKSWGRDNAMRKIKVAHTSRTSAKGQGLWTQPDLVAQVRRRSNARPAVVYHALEVEQPGGFGIESVYQAYEFGRGADYSWVFYSGSERGGTLWTQIETAAKDLGVGVVHAARPTTPSKWKTLLTARQRDRTLAEQDSFMLRSGLEVEQFDDE